jgi:hypothetical protein
VWSEWAEMELRHNNFKAALELMRRATAAPQRPRKLSQEEERKLPVQERLYRSVKQPTSQPFGCAQFQIRASPGRTPILHVLVDVQRFCISMQRQSI